MHAAKTQMKKMKQEAKEAPPGREGEGLVLFRTSSRAMPRLERRGPYFEETQVAQHAHRACARSMRAEHAQHGALCESS